MNIKYLPPLLLGTALLANGQLALAADGKTLPGAACVPKYDYYTFERNPQGYSRNTSSSTQYWSCPIVRDSMSPNIAKAEIKVINATGTFSCTLHSRNASGSVIASSTRSTSLSGTSVQTLSWGSLADANFGYYYFRCGLTAGSSVVSYFWEENT